MIIPEGSLLDPSDSAAVVGGNVQTSQRIVDVIFAAFKTVAASQGCMNNITFGQEDWGYYETVAGGAGAVSANYSAIFEARRDEVLIFLRFCVAGTDVARKKWYSRAYDEHEDNGP